MSGSAHQTIVDFPTLLTRFAHVRGAVFPSFLFNGFCRGNKFDPSPEVHVGIAIAIRGGGLTAPALHNVDQLSLNELMTGLRDLVQRTRAGRIRSSELSDPTVTVSSLGERGVEALYGASTRRRWRSSASARSWCGPG